MQIVRFANNINALEEKVRPFAYNQNVHSEKNIKSVADLAQYFASKRLYFVTSLSINNMILNCKTT